MFILKTKIRIVVREEFGIEGNRIVDIYEQELTSTITPKGNFRKSFLNLLKEFTDTPGMTLELVHIDPDTRHPITKKDPSNG